MKYNDDDQRRIFGAGSAGPVERRPRRRRWTRAVGTCGVAAAVLAGSMTHSVTKAKEAEAFIGWGCTFALAEIAAGVYVMDPMMVGHGVAGAANDCGGGDLDAEIASLQAQQDAARRAADQHSVNILLEQQRQVERARQQQIAQQNYDHSINILANHEPSQQSQSLPSTK